MGNSMEKLRFAPLIRVSGEKKAKHGESLCTQEGQLTEAIRILNGTAPKWYAGQEGAGAETERLILDELMRDAKKGAFDAVIVVEPSRWSRDNIRSPQDLNTFKKLGIRFFCLTTELDLFDPTVETMLHTLVVFGDYQRKISAQKSLLNRVARLRRGVPAISRPPYGRIWHKDKEEWSVDAEIKAKIEAIAHEYLTGDVSLLDLATKYDMPESTLYKVLMKLSGDTWKVGINAPTFNISEKFVLKIPPLLPKKVIQAIKRKAKSRQMWDRKMRVQDYLLGGLIFDEGSGYTMTGNIQNKTRYYRTSYRKHPGIAYSIRADAIEQAVMEEIWKLTDAETLEHAVFQSTPQGQKRIRLEKQLAQYQKSLRKRKRRMDNLLENLADLGGSKPLLAKIKKEDKAIATLQTSIDTVEKELALTPSLEEVDERRKMLVDLTSQFRRIYATDEIRIHELPFEAKRAMVKAFFGGKAPNGQRLGVYITWIEKGKFRFRARGQLAEFSGKLFFSPSKKRIFPGSYCGS